MINILVLLSELAPVESTVIEVEEAEVKEEGSKEDIPVMLHS